MIIIADINEKHNDKTPLLLAVQHQNTESVQALLKYFPDLNITYHFTTDDGSSFEGDVLKYPYIILSNYLLRVSSLIQSMYARENKLSPIVDLLLAHIDLIQ